MTRYDISSGTTQSGLTLGAGDILAISSGGSAVDITVGSGGMDIVSSGGMVSHTTVSSGGVELLVGGTVFDTAVLAGGAQYVSSIGIASGTIIGSGGREIVANGGTVSDAVLSSGGNETVYSGGLASGVTVSSGGMEVVSSGGSVSGTIVSSGGIETVLSGGVASSTTVGSGGELIDVGGKVSSASIESGGTLIIAAGGSATYSSGVGATVTSAYMLVEAGAVVNSSIGPLISAIGSSSVSGFQLTSNETMQVYAGGTTDGTVVGGTSYEIVSSGGIAVGTILSNVGNQLVRSGGVASGTILGKLGWETVYAGGVASGTIIGSAGSETVMSGGITYGDIVSSGGTETVLSGGVASGTTVSATGSQIVSSGGRSVGTLVASGGAENIYSAGTASSTIVSSGGSENIYSGGTASGTVVSSGGTEVVSSGGSASGTLVMSGGREVVSSGGTASDTVVTVGGTVVVSAGGATSGTIINSGGTEIVSSGGTTFGTIVSSGGIEVVSSAGGTVSGVTVSSGGELIIMGGDLSAGNIESGGTLIVTPGGSATYTSNAGATVLSAYMLVESAGTVTSGVSSSSLSGFEVASNQTLHVYAGGTAQGTIVDKGGLELVSAGAVVSDTTVSSGGSELVSSGGRSIGTILSSGGTEGVGIGAVASGTIVSSGGSESVSSGGSTVGTILLAGGNQYVSGGGVASGTIISSGGHESLTGGVTSGTIISSGGLEDVSMGSVASATIITNGGTQVVKSFGNDLKSVISSGGMEVISAGGYASGTIVSSGGELFDQGGSISSITVESGGTLIVTPGGQASYTSSVGATVITADMLVTSGGTLVSAIDSATVSGLQIGSGETLQVFSGGTTNATVLSSGGAEDVLNGGVASGTIVSSGGTQTLLLRGLATGTVISSGGTQVLSAGGVALATVVNNGGTEVATSGSYIIGTIINAGGTEIVSSGGYAANTTFSFGGEEIVSAGGNVSGTIVSTGGDQQVLSGGSALGTVLNDGGSQRASGGLVSGTVVNANSTEYIYSGGVLQDMTVNSGGMVQVFSGGITSGATVESGGSELFYSGGISSDTIISSGGSAYISWGAVASGTIIKAGGVMSLEENSASGTVLERGGEIDISALRYVSGQSSAVYDASGLTLTAGGSTATLSMAGDYTGDYFTLSDDGFGGTLITAEGTPCYCRGTRIATEHGDVAVENLVIGDRLVTVSGTLRPIRWIGRRSYAGQFAATNRAVLPVMFRAGSLGNAVPVRDLMVSPLHAMYLEGVLVPAEALVNGVSILRMESVDRVEYFHLELDTHDVILAEGAPSETFIDDGSRGMFHNAVEYRTLYPDAVRPEARYCAPRVEDGEALAAIKRALVLRATGGRHPVEAGPLRGFVDSVEAGRIAGWAFQEMTPEKPVHLRILDGEHVLAEIVSDTYRIDLAEARIGTGHHAFEFIVPGGLSPDRRHMIRVVRAVDGQDLMGSPWVMEADPTLLPAVLVCPGGPVTDHGQGFLDHTSRHRIVGWACNLAHGSEPVTVQIFDNGHCIAQTLANTYRPDLEAAGFEGGRFGFDILLPGGLSPLSRHIIQVCRAHDGVELVGSPVVIETADSFDADLAESVSRAVNGLSVDQDRERVLSFLLSQAERLRQQEAEEASGREVQDRRRRLSRRFGTSAAETHDRTGMPARRALIIDQRVPDATRDAGSRAILSHMRGLQALGFVVSFVAASEMDSPHGTALRMNLQSEGIMCWHAPFYASVEDVLHKQAGGFDLVYLHRVSSASRYMTLVRQHQPSAHVIYSVADLHHVRLERQAAFEDRPELLAEARKLRLEECSAAWQADAVITHSSEEAVTLRRLVPTAVVHQVPWTIDSGRVDGQMAERQGVLFLAHYGHAPNVDAAQWLVRDIMPHVWAERPDIKCILAGSTMPEMVRRLAGERIEVVGYAPDLEGLLKRVMVSVAPLRFGAGIKGKVLDSLGNGVPCVMTDIAAEGMTLPEDLFFLQTATEAEAIARRIVQLHDDSVEYKRLRLAGLAMIRDQYGKETVINGLRAAIGVEHLPVILTGNAG